VSAELFRNSMATQSARGPGKKPSFSSEPT
jgi:hypothetical protein